MSNNNGHPEPERNRMLVTNIGNPYPARNRNRHRCQDAPFSKAPLDLPPPYLPQINSFCLHTLSGGSENIFLMTQQGITTTDDMEGLTITILR